jgi:MoxR-like ATPase
MNSDWRVYKGSSSHENTPPSAAEAGRQPQAWPEAPPWRRFDLPPDERARRRGQVFRPTRQLVDVVNMAIYLRRPLLITGRPGSGKSTLAWSVAEELGRQPLLKWPITTRTTLRDGLYSYDVLRRLQDVQIYERRAKARPNPRNPAGDIGSYVTLGPLGTAMLPAERPRVLLIDEIDKSDLDLPNDLLDVFEEGSFEIPEIERHQALTGQKSVAVKTHDGGRASIGGDGRVRCTQFPIIIMTSNGERDFPPAFLRRCLRYRMPDPSADELKAIVAAHLAGEVARHPEKRLADFDARIERFAQDARQDNLATDQLLNLLYLLIRDVEPSEDLLRTLLKNLEAGA